MFVYRWFYIRLRTLFDILLYMNPYMMTSSLLYMNLYMMMSSLPYIHTSIILRNWMYRNQYNRLYSL
ncbi:MAG: hypothetical protein IKP84_02175 [Prevotella sp.]|nr:hypothetical protein [Prevotella sp.]